MFNTTDSTKDLPDIRTLELGNNKLHIGRKPATEGNLWEIWFDKGQVPDTLKGRYTSFLAAEKVAKAYLDSKRREVVKNKLEG
jgi:hypothetical protein